MKFVGRQPMPLPDGDIKPITYEAFDALCDEVIMERN